MKIAKVLALVFVLAACSEDKLEDVLPCGQPCYEGLPEQAGVGACTYGTWVCTGDLLTCEGSGQPSIEQCNGVDDNCDGSLIWGEIDHDGDGFTSCDPSCATPSGSVVTTPNSECILDCADWDAAIHPGAIELCDTLDNNCNNQIDEPDLVIPVEGMAPGEVRFCYDGLDPAEVTHPSTACRPGFYACEFGVAICKGAVLPTPERCETPAIDNDCDGHINEGLEIGHNYDFVIAIDMSGSMGSTIFTVRGASTDWSEDFSDPAYQFGLCGTPDEENDDQVTLLQNLTDASTFAQTLSAYGNRVSGTGTEPTLDAVYLTADPSNPLGWYWREGAVKVMILFADEPADSAMGVTEQMAADAAVAAGITVYIFTLPSVRPGYDDIARLTGGSIFRLNDFQEEIEVNLASIISGACIPPA